MSDTSRSFAGPLAAQAGAAAGAPLRGRHAHQRDRASPAALDMQVEEIGRAGACPCRSPGDDTGP